MIVEFKAYVKSASIPMDVKGLRIQEVVFKTPEKKNEFEEVVYKAQFYPANIFRDNIDKFDLQNKVGKKVEVSVYLNGREIVTNNGISYAWTAVVKDIKFLD